MSFLAKIHGPYVEIFGWIWAGIAAAVFVVNPHPWHFFGVFACLMVYLASRDFPTLFKFVLGFAKIEWVSFVSVAVAVLVAAHIGGWHAEIIIAGLATMCVGRLFNYLY